MVDRKIEKYSSSNLNKFGRTLLSAKEKWKFAGISVLIFPLLATLLSSTFSSLHNRPELGIILTTPLAVKPQNSPRVIHDFPDTTDGIHVFNDQLATWEMSEAQFEFAATHYVGTQKIFASDVRRLRAHNPNFIILNYRLGPGLGYQHTGENCEPDGVWLEVIEGEKWVREYPENPQAEWFYEWEGQRVFFCEWGWYLMDIGNLSWREYWAGEVLRNLQANVADGVFVDALFPPNYFGGGKFDPPLPNIDPVFEQNWSSQIEDYINFGQSDELSDYYFIANVGEWVVGRDETDYSEADGIIVEGFGRWVDKEYFSNQQGDWQTQMNRILGMVNLDKVVLLQQYVDKDDLDDRMFLLGSYLLVKGSHTYINLEFSSEPEWFPEYEIPIGNPVGGIPPSNSSLWRSDWGIYARTFSNGLVLVNPSDQTREVVFQKTYYKAYPFGGGIVPGDANISDWAVDYFPVTSASLESNQAVILLDDLSK